MCILLIYKSVVGGTETKSHDINWAIKVYN